MAYIEPNAPFLKGEKTNCIFCHEPGVAYWHTSDVNVCICSDCATTALPKLIADAATAKDPLADLNKVLATVTSNFWRGAAKSFQRLHRFPPPRKPLKDPGGEIEA